MARIFGFLIFRLINSVLFQCILSNGAILNPGHDDQNLFKLVVFSFDGFRHDYIDPNRTPNLYSISKAGVQGDMRSTFVTKTYPNHQSIVTGLYQPFHGVINNKFFDPHLRKEFNVDNSSPQWWDQNNISVPIYVANQYYETNRYSASIQWPGSIASYTDGKNGDKRLLVHYLQEYDPLFDPFKKIDLLMKWLRNPEKPANLAFVYYPEPDSHAHEYGPFSEEVLSQVRKLDTVVGYFREQLIQNGLAHKTNVIYLSDHGMAEIHANRSLYIDKCDKEFPGLKYEMYGASPVWSIIPVSGPNASSSKYSVAESVRDALNSCAAKYFDSKFKVYLQNDIPDSFHYKHNYRILPLFLCAEENYDVNYKDEKWRPKGYPIWGNHGYNASLPSMRPLFLAQGPRFKKSYQHPIVFENIDLYPLMLNLLDIPISEFPSNGTFQNVRQMLSHQLYLNQDDLLILPGSKVPNNTVWIRLFIYLLTGFSLIFMAGACFVFMAGLNRRKNSLSSNRLTDSKFTSYLYRIWNKNGDTSYRMFANERPIVHLDSSSSLDEDDDNDNDFELFRRKDLKKSFGGNQLTEIDWDIIGTGLDIDLASQINEEKGGILPKSDRDKYLRTVPENDSDEDDGKPKESNKRNFLSGEHISLLVDNDDNESSGNDHGNDEEIKAKIDIKEYENLLYNDQNDQNQVENSGKGNNLIDI